MGGKKPALSLLISSLLSPSVKPTQGPFMQISKSKMAWRNAQKQLGVWGRGRPCVSLPFFIFIFSNFIVVQVQFSAFSPHPRLTPSTPVIVHVSFMIVPTNPSPCPLIVPLQQSFSNSSPSLPASNVGNTTPALRRPGWAQDQPWHCWNST